jgi:SAM-dependent methyltransferase
LSILAEPTGRNQPQQFADASFHRWYDFVLGYPDHLVRDIFALLSVERGQIVVDPFCGTGTTCIECAKHQIRSVGIDANPFATFAAEVKTSFSQNPNRLRLAARRAENRYFRISDTVNNFGSDVTHIYLSQSGMVSRGWISPKPLECALALRKAIQLGRYPDLQRFLILALTADLPNKIGNMRFGPQIYKAKEKDEVDPIPYFRERVRLMVEDLEGRRDKYAPVIIQKWDAREIGSMITTPESIDYVVCSPPYPTEHDYTRHMRLELAFTESVSTRECLRKIKRTMIRSHTKGLYKGDEESLLVNIFPRIEMLANQVEVAVADRKSKFEKFYPWVIREYFGGMRRHFAAIFPTLKRGARAAYVVGDQAAYLRIRVETASLLGEVAEYVGFRVKEIKPCRRRWATGLSAFLDENILVLEKP